MSTLPRLQGKRILITAAAQGIGRASALACANEGATVIATDINRPLLQELAAQSPNIQVELLDVRDPQQIGDLAARTAPLDVLFNCAGMVHNGINVDAYPFVEEKEPFLVFIGRSNPEKGLTWAIEVARRAQKPLVMVVKRSEPSEVAYWDEFVAPLLTDDVEVHEDVSHAVKVDLLGRAEAMIGS